MDGRLGRSPMEGDANGCENEDGRLMAREGAVWGGPDRDDGLASPLLADRSCFSRLGAGGRENALCLMGLMVRQGTL